MKKDNNKKIAFILIVINFINNRDWQPPKNLELSSTKPISRGYALIK